MRDPAASQPDGLREALRGAVVRGEFSLVYQPQVSLGGGEIVGAEALLRWNRDGEPVAPDVFVPLLEELGLIAELGHWVLRSACGQAAAWRAAGLPALRMSVNVSPWQFRGADIVATIRDVLAQTGLPPQALGLEVTETALLHDTDRVALALRELQGDGVEIALDDFGTGYSSLSRLRCLPIDLVKIDKSFVHDIAAAGTSMTRSIIQLAHGLHRRVLAEGVETEAQLRLLVEHGCDLIQGWFFAKGVPADEFGAMLRAGKALPRELTHRRLHERTLLLVDDEEHILSALKRLFRRDGYRILTATSGAQGLDILRTEAVDVIVSDQRMPRMTGVEFLRHAKDLRPQTVRMSLSGYTDLQSIIDAVNEGAVYKFLTKPWDDARLREHVAEAFRQRELAEENRRLAHEVIVGNTELAAANQRLGLLAERESQRRHAMQTAAGAARDMVDLMPVAVFGLDPEGLLVYVNRRALEDWPEWAAGLGGEPAVELRQLQATLGGHVDGLDTALGGRPVTAWLRPTTGQGTHVGSLLILQPPRGTIDPAGEAP